ncbi:hypothetical protein GOBAR_DD18652 [Gossypium barbadense]|nr:hypothetical protein GOBAR_DD18652 [Gossypium barbadense]
MGCCAAKPKVLKGQEAEEPIPIPSSKWGKESVPEPTEPENKVEPDLNHHGNTRRSLSNLFKEEEMGMLAKNDNNAEQSQTKCGTNGVRKPKEACKANPANPYERIYAGAHGNIEPELSVEGQSST